MEKMKKIIIPVSGGKDSQATLKLAVSLYPKNELLGLYNNTGFDHPLTTIHLNKMRDLYGVDIVSTEAGTVVEQCRKHKRFPGGGARFCTEELKIWPSKKFYRELAIKQGRGFEVWLGVRANESKDRKIRYAGVKGDWVMPPHEFMKKYPKYLHKAGIMFRLPIVEWSRADVMDYLNGEENPLYAAGFDRVGCFPCLAAGDAYKKKAFEHDEFGKKQYEIVRGLEIELKKSVWTSKGAGCSLCIM